MEKSSGLMIKKMISYNSGDPKRINHALKVYGFAKTIGEAEKLDGKTQQILEIAAILHDIGIKVCEIKYDSTAGGYQELEGPPIARQMLEGLGFDPDVVERVCFLIGHHHTYANIEDPDYQILVEADFLVNIYEDDMDLPQIVSIRHKIFKTKTGIQFLNDLY